MTRMISPSFRITCSPGSQVAPVSEGIWHLEMPAGERGKYRIAQLDDYSGTPRRQFAWQPPLTLSLRARASAEALPGTWGFGLWNDPFSLSLGIGGGTRRFPALPNTAWFFHASPPNYLSFRNDLPAQGFLAATFRSPKIPAPIMALFTPSLILLTLPPTTRLLRRLVRVFIHQAATQVDSSSQFLAVDWHTYQIGWNPKGAVFSVDGEIIFNTCIGPTGPLALVLWIDNQFAALPPNGRWSFGALPNPSPAWIEIADLCVSLPA